MATLPESASSVTISAADVSTGDNVQTSDTYQMHIKKERIKGAVTGLDAIAQACYKAINTERYAYPIYSWNYGIELQDLFGQPIPYVFAVLPQRITDALMQDDRITDVTDFELSHNGGDVLCKFTVKTIYGTLELQKVVTLQ